MSFKNSFLLCCLSIFSHLFSLTEQTTPTHTITVFVHGTFFFRKAVQYTPFRSMIYCKQGLHLAKKLPSNYFFHQVAYHTAQLDPATYNLDQFYTFG